MAFVFLAKRRLELGDQRLVSGIVIKLIARRQDELLECHCLALGVDGTRHAADTATAHGGIVGKQHRKTTQIGRQFVLTERNGRLKPVDTRQAQADHGIATERLWCGGCKIGHHRASAATLLLKLPSATSSSP